MTDRRITIKYFWFIIVALVVFCVAGILSQAPNVSAKAGSNTGSSRYDLTFDETSFRYTKEGVTVERRVYVDEYLYEYLDKITYNVVSTTTGSIMMEQLSSSAGVATGKDITVERENVTVYKEDLIPWTTGKNAYCFTVTTDHCCAFIFTVYYSKGEGEEVEKYYGSDILYVKSIDGKAPVVKIDSYNIYMNTVTCLFDDTSLYCAGSGVKSFTVYQLNTQTGEKTEYYSSDSISSKKASFTLKSGKYKYYVSATDAVGNVSEETLVAIYDVDGLGHLAEAAAMTIESAPDDWSEGFKTKLQNAYSEYQIVMGDQNGEYTDEQKEEKAEALTLVLNEYNGYVGQKLNGRSNVEVRLSGQDYFSDGLTITNLTEACAFVKYGEEGIVTLSVAKYDFAEDKKEILTKSGGAEATETYQFTVQTSTSERLRCEGEFSVPLKVAFTVDGYSSISAVQVIESEEGKEYITCPITEYTDGKIVLNVKNANGTVYFFVQKEQKKSYWLYLLFLIIPVTVGTACFIIIMKRKNGGK